MWKGSVCRKIRRVCTLRVEISYSLYNCAKLHLKRVGILIVNEEGRYDGNVAWNPGSLEKTGREPILGWHARKRLYILQAYQSHRFERLPRCMSYHCWLAGQVASSAVYGAKYIHIGPCNIYLCDLLGILCLRLSNLPDMRQCDFDQNPYSSTKGDYCATTCRISEFSWCTSWRSWMKSLNKRFMICEERRAFQFLRTFLECWGKSWFTKK
jgi:hypothetical protein